MTTITTDMLRYIAHTLGVDKNDLLRVLQREYCTRIDDTPADTEEQTMSKMTITQADIDKHAERIGISHFDATIFAKALGITITPAEPPAEMVKLAREAKMPAQFLGNATIWEDGYVAALQHAVEKAREVRRLHDPFDQIGVLLKALGEGGRDAG